MELTRRNFLKYLGIAAAAGTVQGKIALDLLRPVPSQATTESNVIYKAGVCGICGMNCAMKGKVVDGVLIKLEGNELDQQSGGSLCAKGNAGINILYNPDRLKYPMVRTNPEKGIGVDPKWKRISWEEAFDLAAQKLSEIKEQYGGKAIAWFGGHKGTDFLKAIGSPNDFCHHSTCDTVREVACEVMLGTSAYIPDFAETDYILSFGWDQFGKAKNAWARLMAKALDRGAKLVVFDPRLSPTASKAQEWYPVVPGTDHALVLAMLNVIISEKLYDAEYVAKYTTGFDKLAEEVRKYSPEWAAELTGVPAADIVRIAREFAAAKSAVIPCHKREAAQVHPNGMALVQGMIALMAITGNFERRGGAMFRKKAKLNKVSPPEEAPGLETTIRVDGADRLPILLECGHAVYQSIADAILEEKPYPLKAAIIYKQGLFSMPNPAKFVEAFKKLFIININIQPDEMALLADLVLPDVTYMESATVSVRKYHALYPQIAVSEPMVKPMYETKSRSTIIREIAKRMGIDQYLNPSGSSVRDQQLSLYGLTQKDVIAQGGVISPEGTEVKYKDLTKLSTPSGKIELYATRLAEHGYNPLPTHRDEWILPKPKAGEFYLVTTRFATHRHAQMQNYRWVHEIYPENYVSINKKTAAILGIADGEEVIVESPYGQIKIKAKLTEAIRPDTVCIPHGYGHWSKYLSNAYSKGANDGDLAPARSIEETLEMDPVAGSNNDCHLLVKVRKA
ncbi:MAG: molybdopterin-dependent oxidoreductase [Firmicutes bacterium]|nr:molybdopterin-dependent oxidoreductase [Bacillota bacterium]